jgi:mRNA interferase RelE/StbE
MNESPWTIHIAPRVRKQLERIGDRAVVGRLRDAVERLALAPYRGKPLTGHAGVRSLRVGTPGGEYRVIYTAKEIDHAVLVALIGPRESVYALLARSGIES